MMDSRTGDIIDMENFEALSEEEKAYYFRIDKEYLAEKFKQERLSGLEIASMMKSQKNIFKLPKKKLRNIPCPCGSGKKYKKCCFYSKRLKEGERA